MKKYLCLFLCLLFLASSLALASEEEEGCILSDMEGWIIVTEEMLDHGIFINDHGWVDARVDELAALMNEALDNPLYLSQLALPSGAQETLTSLKAVDFTAYIARFSSENESFFHPAVNERVEQALQFIGTSDALYQSLRRKKGEQSVESIYDGCSAEEKQLLQGLQLEKLYYAPENIRNDIDVFLFYEEDFALWLWFDVLDNGIVQVKAYPAPRSGLEFVIEKFDLQFSGMEFATEEYSLEDFKYLFEEGLVPSNCP